MLQSSCVISSSATTKAIASNMSWPLAKETDIQEKNKKKAKSKQIRARNGKDKVKSQAKCEAALEVLPANMEAEAKAELNKKAHSAMILCLGNKVLREVTEEMTAARISEHIDEFNKIVLDLANIEVKFEDEDLALLLLTSLPASYEHFIDNLILYGHEALTLEDVMATLNSKEIKERSKAKGDDGEGLYERERTNRNDGDERTGTCSARLDHRFRMFIPHDTQ
ncbi:hypothetical protein Tco_1048945, partial [Tanacetum coccineum]